MATTDIHEQTFSSLPKEDVVLVGYGDIYHREREFSIVLFFAPVGKTEPIYSSFGNIKTQIAFPLGGIYSGGRYTGRKSESQEVEISFEIPETGLEHTKGSEDKDIWDSELIKSLSADCDNSLFKPRSGFKAQLFSIARDRNSGKTIYIPHYEILRYFYCQSLSMTRALFHGEIEQLYETFDEPDGDGAAKIHLQPSAKSTDAVDIYRFAFDGFARNQWDEVRRSLSANAEKRRIELTQRGYSYSEGRTFIQAGIPVSGLVSMRVRTINLNENSMLLLQILQEDTRYPFETLEVWRTSYKGGDVPPEAVLRPKDPKQEHLTHIITADTPSSEYAPVGVMVDGEKTDKSRLDLLDKEVVYNTLKQDRLSDFATIAQETEEQVNISPADASSSGEQGTAKADIQRPGTVRTRIVYGDNGELPPPPPPLSLNNFRSMLYECSNTGGLSYRVLELGEVANCSPDGKFRSKSYLGNTNHRRRYLLVEVSLGGRVCYALEIERDATKLSSLTTLLFVPRSDVRASARTIMKGFVENPHGSWPTKIVSENTRRRARINHASPPLNSSTIRGWARRFLGDAKVILS